ncbi:MAG: helix-turn-helix domain-containing protein [Nocardioidaceae bacterium]|nr:helix-turn-helix domain-containing protein [Nocardioidaceae bacterium]
MGAFAQFERDLIRQRQADGIAAAKKRGVYKGRPRTLQGDKLREVRNAALAGTPKVQIAREHGISRSTLSRYLTPASSPLGCASWAGGNLRRTRAPRKLLLGSSGPGPVTVPLRVHGAGPWRGRVAPRALPVPSIPNRSSGGRRTTGAPRAHLEGQRDLNDSLQWPRC